MPARVRIPHRIVVGVAVPVQSLRGARACPERSEGSRHDGVRLDEAPGGHVGVAACGCIGVRASGALKLGRCRGIGIREMLAKLRRGRNRPVNGPWFPSPVASAPGGRMGEGASQKAAGPPGPISIGAPSRGPPSRLQRSPGGGCAVRASEALTSSLCGFGSGEVQGAGKWNRS